METKLYTKNHEISLLKKYTSNKSIFTSEERSNLSLYDIDMHSFKYQFKTRIIKRKLELLEIIDFIKKNKIKKIISIGSQYPIQEYFIFKKTGSEINCYDFDEVIINNTNKYFGKKISLNFYDINTSITNILKKNHNVELIIFFQSLYVLNKKKYEIYLKEINKQNVRYVIDKTSISSFSEILVMRFKNIIKFLLRIYLGKFHGYTKTKKTISNIYKNANYKIIHSYKNYFYIEKM